MTTVAPLIGQVDAVIDDLGTITLRAEIADEGGAVIAATVLFTNAAAPGAWTVVPLAAQTDGSWTGSASANGATEVDFFVQGVDQGGNVAVSTNKGAYHRRSRSGRRRST